MLQSSKALNALTYRFSRVTAVVSGGRTRRKYSTPDLSRTSRNCLRKVTSRIFTPRFLSTRDDRNLKRYELGNARCVRPIGGGVRRHPFANLSRCPNQRTNEGTPSIGGQCSHRAGGRSDLCAARERRARR